MKTCDFPAYTIADLIKTRQISAVEVLEETLDRVRAVDGRTGQVDGSQAQSKEDLSSVHAFTMLADEHARGQAEKVDQMVKAGENPGPLAGVPYTAKDIFTVKGIPACSLHSNGRRADGGSWCRDDRKS
jgi:aspartyl-tRNA(Asn)/glutamyl-tRNA(Gln) amidotransferase subunit A